MLTMSDTSLVVGTIESRKKPITAALNWSRSAGYRLNACCRADEGGETRVSHHNEREQAGGRQRKRSVTHDLVQDLGEDPDELVVDELAALETRLLEALDLLLDNHLKRSSPNEQGRRRSLDIEKERDRRSISVEQNTEGRMDRRVLTDEL